MTKISPSCSKTIKITSFVIIVLTCLLFTSPLRILAVNGGPAMNSMASVPSSTESVQGLTMIGRGVLNGVMGFFAAVTTFVTSVLADLAATFLVWTLTFIKAVSYTNSPAVQLGWPLVRDIANMMIVLGFIIIGVSTALRIQEYEAKKLLKNLIVVALLVNFSLLLCGIFVDGTNIAMNFFFGQVLSPGGILNYSNVSNFGSAVLDVTAGFTVYVPRLMALSFFNIIAFFVCLLYVVLLISRVIAIWALVIVSPLAFVCYVFPATKKVWDQWWTNFFQWCIIGVPASLFYYIGAKMIDKMTPFPTLKALQNDAMLPSSVIDNMNRMLGFIIPGLFLIIGFMVSLQFSAMGASAIMKFADKHKGKIMGGGAGIMGKASSTIGSGAGKLMSKAGSYMESKGGGVGKVGSWINKGGQGVQKIANTDLRASVQNAKSGLTRFGEKIGAVGTGVDATETQSRIKASTGLATAAYTSGNKSAKERVRDAAKKGDAGSLQTIADAGDLHEIFRDKTTGNVDYVAMHQAIKQAEGNGVGKGLRKTAEEHNYQLASFDDGKALKELTTAQTALIDSTLTAKKIDPLKASTAQRMTVASNLFGKPVIDQAREKAKLTQLDANLPKITASEAGRVDPADLTGPAGYKFVRDNFDAGVLKKFKTAPAPLLFEIKNHVGAVGIRDSLENDHAIANAANDVQTARAIRKLITEIQKLP